MTRSTLPFLATALAASLAAMPAWADPGTTSVVQVAELSVNDMPYSRALGVNGVVKGGFAASLSAAGVPTAAALEAEKAFGTEIDIGRDVRDGDRFYVRYEQNFTLDGRPFGDGRVVWAEIRTSKRGVLAVHRFRPVGAEHDLLWLLSGQGTGPAPLKMPLEHISITSGFGMRADPFDQPAGRFLPMGPVAAKAPGAGAPGVIAPSPLGGGLARPNSLPNSLGASAANVNAPTSLGLSMGLAPVQTRFTGFGRSASPSIGRGQTFMHTGVDLMASPGTPIEAAGDGVVVGAAPNGRYGNWIQVDHSGDLATVYGHLSAFAPGIKPGVKVKQGDIIGFTGNTGHTTGPHLHFEILTNGRPGNPISNPAIRHAQLRGADMDHFRKVVAEDVAERARESKSM
jgi:murein DD-endopeptidase MepM/ murein hydrolase activator NlpD